MTDSERSLPQLDSFEAMVELCREMKEARLASDLANNVHLVHFEPGRLEYRPGKRARSDLAGRLGKCLQEWTGRRWIVSLSSEAGQPPLREQERAAEDALRRQVMEDPLVRAVLDVFPEATLVDRRGTPVQDAAAVQAPGDEDTAVWSKEVDEADGDAEL
jgi:DNA polymerase-3 subunit gamma/tau